MRDGPKPAEKADWLMDAGTKAAAEPADDTHVFPSARGVLTAAEIEALLRPNLDQAALAEPAEPPAASATTEVTNEPPGQHSPLHLLPADHNVKPLMTTGAINIGWHVANRVDGPLLEFRRQFAHLFSPRFRIHRPSTRRHASHVRPRTDKPVATY